MKGLGLLRKEKNEKVHIFTQQFSMYLKNFSETDRPSHKVLIEYYTLALRPELAMFAKMKARPMLVETYEEEERLEAERESIEDYRKQPEEKTIGRRTLLLSKPTKEQSHDFEGMLKMIQKLSNQIMDLEKEREV